MTSSRARLVTRGAVRSWTRTRGRGLALTAPAWLPMAIAVAAGIAGFAWMTWLGWRKAEGLTTGAFDQAYFEQLAWSIGHGRGFTSTFTPGNFLGLHFSPLLVVPAALQLLWPDVRLLSLLQAAALGAAVPAAFLFFRSILARGRRTGDRRRWASWLALALAAPMPIWPIFQQQIRADFHTESLALPLVLLAGWAGLTRRTALMVGLALVALLAKEDQVFPVAVVGLLVAARAPGRLSMPATRAAVTDERRWRGLRRGPERLRLAPGPRRAGLVLMGIAAAWGIAVFGVVKPFLAAGVAYDTDPYYAWLGGGFNVLLAPFRQTDAVISTLTRPDGWGVAAWLVIGLGGLGLLRPRWLLLVLPPLAAHLLSSQPTQRLVMAQYGLLLLLPAMVAAGLGGRRLMSIARRVRRRLRRRSGPAWVLRQPVLALLFAVPAFVAAFAGGAVPPFTDRANAFFDRPAVLDQVRAVAAQVPQDAILSADWGVAPAVAQRPRLYVLPYAGSTAYILVDSQAFVTGTFLWRDRPEFVAMLEASDRPLLVDDGRFRLWGPVP